MDRREIRRLWWLWAMLILVVIGVAWSVSAVDWKELTKPEKERDVDQGLEEVEVVAGDAGGEAEASEAVEPGASLVAVYTTRFSLMLRKTAKEIAAEAGRRKYTKNDVRDAWNVMRHSSWSPEER